MSDEFEVIFSSDSEYENETDGLVIELSYNDKEVAVCYRSKKSGQIEIELPDFKGKDLEKYVYRKLPLETFLEGIEILKEKSKEL